jgi:hypothetical protein
MTPGKVMQKVRLSFLSIDGSKLMRKPQIVSVPEVTRTGNSTQSPDTPPPHVGNALPASLTTNAGILSVQHWLNWPGAGSLHGLSGQSPISIWLTPDMVVPWGEVLVSV